MDNKKKNEWLDNTETKQEEQSRQTAFNTTYLKIRW